MKSCTVKPGTKIFVSISWECSQVPKIIHGTTEDELLQCARENDVQRQKPTYTVDGKSVTVTEVRHPRSTSSYPRTTFLASAS